MTQDNSEIRKIRTAWELIFPFALTDEQLGIWLMMHNAGIVRQGIARSGMKYQKLCGQMEPENVISYASAVMNRLAEEKRQKETAA